MVDSVLPLSQGHKSVAIEPSAQNTQAKCIACMHHSRHVSGAGTIITPACRKPLSV